MSRPVANVNPSYDTWSVLLERVNEMADTISKYAVTTFANTTGANTYGNGTVYGVFGFTTLFARDGLRGGTVANSANLAITSNTIFTGDFTKFDANVYIIGANTTITSNSMVIAGNNLVVNSIATFAANTLPSANGINFGSATQRWNIFGTTVNANTVLAESVTIANTVTTYIAANSDVGANVTAYRTVMTIPRDSCRSGQMRIQLKNTDSYQVSESSFIHDNNDVYLSTYATMFSNSQLGEVSAAINGLNIEVRVLQARPNLDARIVVTAFK